ncbi:phosphatase PAP2 family protein, partial [Effusibacillus lacus]
MAIRDLIEREFQAFDKLAGETVQMWQSEILTDLMLVITQLGSTLIYVCVLVLVVGFLLLTSRFWEALILFISLLGSWLLNNLMKEMFARPRPALQHLVEATGYSFPSGHASISTAFYGMIGYLIWVSLKGQYRRAWHVPVLTCLVLVAIGISRVY